MKKIPGLALAFILLRTTANSQEKDYIQNPTFGIHFIFNDFKSAQAIRSTSLREAIRNKQFGKIKEMSPGLALNYIQGLTPSFDFSTSLTGSFLDYPLKDDVTAGKDNLLLEIDASLRGKMLSNKYVVSPYFQVGVGASKYKGYFGAFIPAGLGLQVNIFDEAFLLVNAQYRLGISPTTSHHFFYGIGLAGVIGKRRTARPGGLPSRN
jgi:OmpA-OmpF porin, OOP family